MNNARVLRLLKLITLLRSGRDFVADGLAQELRVSRRTLFRDLKMLEQAGVPYRFDHGNNSYRISDGFFLPPISLSLEESLALLLVTRGFIARQVHPAYQHAVDAALKIESTLPPAMLEHCGAWLSGLSIHWPPASPADAAADVFGKLQRALADSRRVRLHYDSASDGREIELLADPLRLIFMTRGWYLIAMSHHHGEPRTFKIDRVTNVRITDEKFTPDKSFSEKAYFGKAWRMIPEGRLYAIRLCFSPEVAASVEEVQWHPTQSTTRLADGGLLFEAEVDGLREVAPWILGYGDFVEVLGPIELRHMVRERAERMVARAVELDGVELGAGGR